MKNVMCFMLGWGVFVASSVAAEPSRLILTENYPPYNMLGERGEIGGLSTELVREMFRRTGERVELRLQPWARAIKIAETVHTACVYSATRTPEREARFKWVGPLLRNIWAIYAGPHSPIRIERLPQLQPYVIGGYNGDAEALFLQGQGMHVELSPSDDLNPRKLLAGRIDYWATSIYRYGYLSQRADLGRIRKALEFNAVSLYLACNLNVPDDEIVRLNGAINAMRRDGFVDHARMRYLAD